MRSPAALPKSILIVELVGMALLTLAWLSLNQYVQLPAPFASPTAALIMIFADPADDPGGDSLNVANSENCRAAVDR